MIEIDLTDLHPEVRGFLIGHAGAESTGDLFTPEGVTPLPPATRFYDELGRALGDAGTVLRLDLESWTEEDLFAGLAAKDRLEALCVLAQETVPATAASAVQLLGRIADALVAEKRRRREQAA